MAGTALCAEELMTTFRRAQLIRNAIHLIFSLLAVVLGLVIAESRGQEPTIHYLHRADLPPGTVGQGMALLGDSRRGYVQPVELHVPAGVRVSLPEGGLFGPGEKGPIKVGMVIGQVYRIKLTDIPRQPGLELFPTVEVINRLHPPAGKEAEFPVPIQFTLEEINLALDNHFITRVIYLENPDIAFPQTQRPSDQRYFEVRRHEDPLQVADRLGRPMAILRMGSRVPDLQHIDGQQFLYGAPSVHRLPRVEELPSADLQTAQQPTPIRPRQNYPRVQLQPLVPTQLRSMQR